MPYENTVELGTYKHKYTLSQTVCKYYFCTVEINENIYENIQNNVCRFNEESNKPYELSFSIGICRNSNQPLDKFLNFMDLAMYQEKSRYYEEGCHNRRVR